MSAFVELSFSRQVRRGRQHVIVCMDISYVNHALSVGVSLFAMGHVALHFLRMPCAGFRSHCQRISLMTKFADNL